MEARVRNEANLKQDLPSKIEQFELLKVCYYVSNYYAMRSMEWGLGRGGVELGFRDRQSGVQKLNGEI